MPNSPKKELSVQIRHINSVHIDDMNVPKPAERQVGQDLASQTSSADDEHFALVP